MFASLIAPATLRLERSLSSAQAGGVLVAVGSRTSPFPQSKQNEPAVAIDPLNPSIAVAGANDEIDVAPCAGSSCPFTPGVGTSGIYFSSTGGASWSQPTYSGWAACTGTRKGGPLRPVPRHLQA